MNVSLQTVFDAFVDASGRHFDDIGGLFKSRTSSPRIQHHVPHHGPNGTDPTHH
jgi:hypothetical protein